ncbi:MAG: FliA/WhiG family RNA polymerase sigma factor [Thermodesulfobacteriota bacterium]|nr:FliA/WhiG family RNA polymerase sigma factor [Thermodesulfobacteriota bacterium]
MKKFTMNGALKQWEEGSRKIDPLLRDQLIQECSPLIKYIASRIAFRLPPNIDIDDVITSGIIGLIDAIDKFDPQRGVKFRTYAEFRIRGAMLDELRSLDMTPRSIRYNARKLEEAQTELEHKLGRPPSNEEIAERLGMKVEKIHEIINQANGVSFISLDELGYSFEDGQERDIDTLLNDYLLDPALRLKIKETKDIVAEAIEELDEKPRLVITLYYYEELTMKEIGTILGVTESRVSQLHSHALKQLRKKFEVQYKK